MALGTDIRHALRSYAHSPFLTATLVLTVAVGAGANAAILGFIGGLITHSASSPDPADAERFARVAVLLLLSCGFVLVLACATVTGLLLSRSSARTLETAVKVAIGATRRRLAWQCLVDSLIVTIAGGVLGVLFAWWTSQLFPMFFFAEDAEHLALAPDLGWLSAAAGVWVVVMVACGMVPVLTVPHRDPSLVLRRDASRSSTVSRRFRLRLVATQIALCSILVVVAGVIREDLHSTMRTSRGRVVGSLLVAQVTSDAGPLDARNGLQYLDAVAKSARGLADVTSTAWAATLPGGRLASQDFKIELPETEWREIRLDVTTFSPEGLSPDELLVEPGGRMFGGRDGPGTCRVGVINKEAAGRYFDGDAVGRSLEDAIGRTVQIVGVLASAPRDMAARPALFYYDTQTPMGDGIERDQLFRGPRSGAARSTVTMDTNATSPEYFDLFADPPIAGRVYGDADRDGACRVAVVSENAAHTEFGGRAVGAVLIDPAGDRIEIVGVVRAEALGAVRQAPAPTVFLPLAQAYRPVVSLAMRAGETSREFRAAAGAKLGAVGGGRLLSSVATLEEHLERTSLAAARIATTLVGVCAALALVLSVAGVYAVMADLVLRRRREIALRVALGAGTWRLVGSIVREGLRIAAAGGAAGLVLAIAGTPLLDRFVVRPQLPGLMVIVVAISAVGVLVTIACAVPAWRAVSVDPRAVMHDPTA